MSESVEIEVRVEEIVFHNEDNGYTVLEVSSGKRSLTAVGVLPPVAAGTCLRLAGTWMEHPVYGRQLKIASSEVIIPQEVGAIEAYLSSGLIRGVGRSMAHTLVETFGEEVLDILAQDPDRLLSVKGIGKARLKMIRESYEAQIAERETYMFLQQAGVSQAHMVRILKAYGADARRKVESNPYRLVEEIEGIGFRIADRIAMRLGVEPESDLRISAAIRYVLQENLNMQGHCYLPREKMVDQCLQVVDTAVERVESLADGLLLHHTIRGQILPGKDGEEIQAMYLPAALNAECSVANLLCRLLLTPPAVAQTDAAAQIAQMELMEGIAFHAQQREAISRAVSSGLCVITGGPGTGKTTIIKCIIRILGGGDNIALAAPTGRAAKRMSEACGREARTLHRLLEFSGEAGEFQRNGEHPLDVDTLIIDEMSMVDIFLMDAVLRALRPGTRLVLVGDSDQLPSVGPGNVLSDILASGEIPCVRLTEIFRQEGTSMIVVNAHAINQGEFPRLNSRGGDFYFQEAMGMEEAAERVVELCSARLPAYYGIDPGEIQVLSPTRKGECGVIALNTRLQACFNPPNVRRKERRLGENLLLREGDKVMQTRNNYQLSWQREGLVEDEEGTGVFNGDIGRVERIDNGEEKTVTVRFDDDRVVVYGGEDVLDLTLAYCISVHKSQGSEFPVVVMPVVPGPPMLQTRNLFYTAVTRAKRAVMLVGRRQVIAAMVDNAHLRERYSALTWRILETRRLYAQENGKNEAPAQGRDLPF